MYACMYVCMHVMYVCMCMYVCACMCTRIHVNTHKRTQGMPEMNAKLRKAEVEADKARLTMACELYHFLMTADQVTIDTRLASAAAAALRPAVSASARELGLSVDVTQSLQDLETLDESKFYGCQPPCICVCTHRHRESVCVRAIARYMYTYRWRERKRVSVREKRGRKGERERSLHVAQL